MPRSPPRWLRVLGRAPRAATPASPSRRASAPVMAGETPSVQDGTVSLRSRTTAVLQGMRRASLPGRDEPHGGGSTGIGPAIPRLL
jgi:hypothetical protein